MTTKTQQGKPNKKSASRVGGRRMGTVHLSSKRLDEGGIQTFAALNIIQNKKKCKTQYDKLAKLYGIFVYAIPYTGLIS
jgi:hypothetical protein